MSEWITILAVFWLLWGLDGVRLVRRAVWTFRVGRRGRGGAVSFGRLGWPAPSPLAWRIAGPDVPLALSEDGIVNVSAGAAGRPAAQPEVRQACRWSDIRAVGLAGGWIHVNGRRFCPDTGHVTAPELWALVGTAPAERGPRIEALVARWLRPAQVARRGRSLAGRTRWVAGLNLAGLLGMVLLGLYLAGDVAGRVPARMAERVGAVLPWCVLLLALVHGAAWVAAWRARRSLPVRGGDPRSANLWSALLLPPQALRLRALLGDGFFPAQHPLAVAAAVASRPVQRQLAFNVVADLRWPREEPGASALERAVLADFRLRLTPRIEALVTAAGWSVADLLQPPRPDLPTSCAYCPRCRDQFVAGPSHCPQGILLQPLRAGAPDPGRNLP